MEQFTKTQDHLKVSERICNARSKVLIHPANHDAVQQDRVALTVGPMRSSIHWRDPWGREQTKCSHRVLSPTLKNSLQVGSTTASLSQRSCLQTRTFLYCLRASKPFRQGHPRNWCLRLSSGRAPGGQGYKRGFPLCIFYVLI